MKYIKQFSLVTILSISLFVILAFVSNLNAQGQLIVSPALIRYSVDPGTSQDVPLTLKNSSELSQTYEIKLVFIQSDSTKELKFIPNTQFNNILALTQNKVELAPGEETKITVSTNIPKDFLNLNMFPALSIQASESDNNASVGVNQRIIVPILPTYTKETQHNINIGVISLPSPIIVNEQFGINASIQNLQNRYFAPAGRIEIYKNDKLLKNINITGNLPEGITNGETATFNTIVDGKDFLENFNIYEIKLFISDIETKQEFLTTYKMIYIPLATFVVLIGVIIILLAVAVMAFIYRIRKQRYEQKKS